MSLESEAAIFIKKFEGFTPIAKWDVNAYRIGHGSDTITLPDGTYRKVVQGDTTTRESAQKDLERRIKNEFIPRARHDIGEPYWGNLPDQAKVALISFAYNYGSINKQDIVYSARSGDLNKLSRAIVDSTYNDNKGLSEDVRNSLRARRAEEAGMVQTAKNVVKRVALFSKAHTGMFIAAALILIAAILLLVYRKKITTALA